MPMSNLHMPVYFRIIHLYGIKNTGFNFLTQYYYDRNFKGAGSISFYINNTRTVVKVSYSTRL